MTSCCVYGGGASPGRNKTFTLIEIAPLVELADDDVMLVGDKSMWRDVSSRIMPGDWQNEAAASSRLRVCSRHIVTDTMATMQARPTRPATPLQLQIKLN